MDKILELMISRIENLEKRVMQLEEKPQVKVDSEGEKLLKKLYGERSK